jgi:hypothetical protein
MLLTVSVISVLIAGAIGYVSGTNSLRQAEYHRLTQLRESRAREITAYYRSITGGASIVTHGATAVNASRDFTAAFNELQTTPLPPNAEAAVSNYYTSVFGPTLSQRTGKQMYAEGEMIQRADPVPDAIGFIAEGSVTMVVYTQDGIEVPVGHREAGDYIGTTALTRQRVVSDTGVGSSGGRSRGLRLGR